MWVIAHGVDIVQCSRIAQMREKHGAHFLERVYTSAERAYCLNCKDVAARLSGRFAAKEAVLKALGTGVRGGINWIEVETLPDVLGRPLVTLHGEAARRAAQLGITTVLVSISHTGDYAIASALGGSEEAGRSEAYPSPKR